MKHKKGFAAVLLTLIISALLSVSAFAASDRFSDVPEASPFYESVTYLAGQGITYGTGNGRYAPDTPITVGNFIVPEEGFQRHVGGVGHRQIVAHGLACHDLCVAALGDGNAEAGRLIIGRELDDLTGIFQRHIMHGSCPVNTCLRMSWLHW